MAGRSRFGREGLSRFISWSQTVLVTLAWGCVLPAPAHYALQVGAFGNAPQADSYAEQLRLSGKYSPVSVVSTTGVVPWKVRVGSFPTRAEAWAYVSRLTTSTLVPAAMVVQADSINNATEGNKIPVVWPFDTSGLNASPTDSGTEFQQVAGLDSASEGRSNTRAELEALIGAEPTGLETNKRRLRLARRILRLPAEAAYVEQLLDSVQASGTPTECTVARFIAAHAALAAGSSTLALTRFTDLANDPVIPRGARMDSMRCAAGIYHTLTNYPDAWLAWEQVAQVGSTARLRSEARMQQAGLAYELVSRGQGSWDEVRALCSAVSEDMQTSRDLKATAALMHLEAYYLEDRFEQSLTEVDAFLAIYSDIPRETMTARLWRALALYRLGRPYEAKAEFENVADGSRSLSSRQKFAGIEPRARAAVWLAVINAGVGDSNASVTWRNVLKTEFPTSPDHARSLAIFGDQ